MKKEVLFFLLCLSFISLSSQNVIERWQNSTVSLGVIQNVNLINPTGDTVTKKIYNVIGTGVIFYVTVGENIIPTLITAKHIFENPEEKWTPSELQLRFSWFDDKPVDEYFGFRLPLVEAGKKAWFEHDDSNVDLAAMPLFIPEGTDLGTETLTIQPYSQIAEYQDIYAGGSVFVLGYPGAIDSEYWTRALLRQGIVAWVSRGDSLQSKVLIDCDVFPGNSGGPVFYLPIGLGKNSIVELGGEVKFMGIVSQRRFSKTDVFDSKTNKPIVIDKDGTRLNSYESIGIGVVEPAMRVRELLQKVEGILNNR